MAAQMLASASAAPLAAAKPCRLHSTAKPAQAALAHHTPFLQGKALRAPRCCQSIGRSSIAARCQGDYKVTHRTKSISCPMSAAANASSCYLQDNPACSIYTVTCTVHCVLPLLDVGLDRP